MSQREGGRDSKGDLLFHCPNGCNGLSWARPKPGASTKSPCGAGTQALRPYSFAFHGSLAGTESEVEQPGIQTDAHMEYQKNKQQLNPICHTVGPSSCQFLQKTSDENPNNILLNLWISFRENWIFGCIIQFMYLNFP